MGQLNFAANNFIIPNIVYAFNNASLTFCPLELFDSISWATVNIINKVAGTRTVTKTFSISIGLYSLNGSSLSLANSIFGSQTHQYSGNKGGYLSLTSASATQNISPGTWWLGLLISSTAQSTNLTGNLVGQNANLSAANAFPGGFIGGAMTASTNALPGSIATSDLDITGQDAFTQPIIILTA